MGLDVAMRRIPRHPQLFDHDRWAEHGFEAREDSEVWSDRACGVACVGMVLEYVHGDQRSTIDLLHEGRRRHAYSTNGWVHAGLARLLATHGVTAKAVPVGSINDLGCLVRDEGPVIASVTLRFPEDGRKGGHLVLVTGIEWRDGRVTTVHVNDPSRWGALNSTVSARRFAASFTGRIVKTSVPHPAESVA